MEGRHFFPGDVRLLQQRSDHLELRGARGDDDVGVALLGQGGANQAGAIFRGQAAAGGGIGSEIDLE